MSDPNVASFSAARMPSRGRRLLALAAVIAAAIGGGVGVPSPAAAATVGTWAEWDEPGGSAGARTGIVSIAALPALEATVTSTAGAFARASGASTWLSEGTPVGAVYGSSRGQAYVTVGAASGAPSVTTYTFSRPTPASGWAFALGDIDADQVRVTATAPDGSAVPAAALGFRGGFNYCAEGLAGKPSCSGSSPVVAGDVATWNPDTQILVGNPSAADTQGAAGWFEPSLPLATLTLEFSVRSGIPIFQTWFASLARDITGTLTDAAGDSTLGVAVELINADGTVVATTAADAAGRYAFTGVQATAGYTVAITPPAGKTTDAATAPADLRATDAVVDFGIRDLAPVSVSGSVSDTTGDPVAGAVLSLGDPAVTQTSGTDGSFAFDDVAPGTYQTTIAAPSGYTVADSPEAFTVAADSEAAVTDQDFVLAPVVVPAPVGTLTGTVLDAAGDPVPGAAIDISGDAEQVTTATAPDGTFAAVDLGLGSYAVTLTPPAGFTVDGDPTRIVELTAGSPAVVVDFAVTAVSEAPGPDPIVTVPPIDTAPAPGAPGATGAIAATGGTPPVAPLTGGLAFLGLGAILAVHAVRRPRATSPRG